MIARRALLAVVPAVAVSSARAAAPMTVVTGLQATYSLTSALAAGSAIAVAAAFPADIGMTQQAGWLARKRRPEFLDLAARADAAVSLRGVWPADPLFPAIRGQRIRAIEIDAARSFDAALAGVAILPGAAPWVWLSLGNAVRMADIVAADLVRLAPDDAAVIGRNHMGLRQDLLPLKDKAAARLAGLDDPAAILLAPSLAYLLGDLGLRVAASFPKPDVDWDAGDLAAFRAGWHAAGTSVVAASQSPAPGVAAAIAELGGRIVVLDPLDPGRAGPDGRLDPAGYLAGQRENVAALLGALQT